MSEATITPPAEDPTPVSEGPHCEKCGYATAAAACPKCGWYPSLGIHVEIDEAFEAVMTAPAAVEDSAAQATDAAKPEWQKHVEVWKDLIPGWGWVLIGTTLGIVAAAIAARVATLEAPSIQTAIGVGGLAGGLLGALVLHVMAFILGSSDNPDFGVADLVIKPLKVWKAFVAELPERLWLINGANAALSTALSAALIVGGIPYEKLLDWGFVQPPKKNIVDLIAQKAAENGRDVNNLEDAITELGRQAGVDKMVGRDADAKPEKPRRKLEALVIGFRTDRDGRLDTLLLAADRYGKLRYIGAVQPRMDQEDLGELLVKMEDNVAPRPFVQTAQSGVWLRPRFMVRVTYTEWPEEKGKRPKDLQWDRMLDEIKMPW